jgi:perosamine synthetase
LPAFVDIDPATLNFDPAEMRGILARDYVWDRAKRHLVNRHSGRVLKAVLPVHLFGLPCPMGAILETAREYNMRVLEDACEALGAEYCGRRVGTFGDAAAFAFYPNKQMTTAEGGMIVTDNPRIARLCRSLRNHGRDDDAGWLCHARLGYNYRLSELHCALGLAQLEKIEKLLFARERVAALYSRSLADVSQIELPGASPGTKRSWFVYVIRLRGPSAAVRRDALMAALKERGIPSRPYFPAIHRQPYFREIPVAPNRPLPHTDSASACCLALPFFSSMTASQVAEVCATVRDILAEARRPARAAEKDSREVARHAS